MPLTIRSPQYGGVGTWTPRATSDRASVAACAPDPDAAPSRATAGSATAGSETVARTRRGRTSGSAAPGTPRLTATIASIRRSPSNASRA